MRLVRPLLASLISLLTGLIFACQQDFVEQPKCENIPIGGCPAVDGACGDVSCVALYQCTSAGWVKGEVCPPGRDAGTPFDAAQQDANGIEVCGVPLEDPDCTLAQAKACDAGCCGCEDVYSCIKGSWVPVGGCADGGLSL